MISAAVMGDNVNVADLYADARYTAEISNRMQVPDRIMVSGNSSPTHSAGGGGGGGMNDFASSERYNDLGMRQRDPRIDMQVPDRILVAGGDNHVAAKSTPRYGKRTGYGYMESAFQI